MAPSPRRAVLFAAAMSALLGPSTSLRSQQGDGAPVGITVITDLDGDFHDSRSGSGGVDATRMAVEDFGGKVLGRPVVVDARNDHNMPDGMRALVEGAFDAGADLLMDVQNSPIAVAASKVAAFTPHILAQGGVVLQPFVFPVGAADIAPMLKEVEALKPDVVGVFSAGSDADERVTQVNTAGRAAVPPAHLTTALLDLTDVERVKGGYAGVRATVPWYWDMDDRTRAWADRFAAAHGGLRPTAAQAADCSATMQWLAAVATAGTAEADAVVKALDGRRFDDMFARHATWRAGDYMMTHDLYVVDVLPPAQIRAPHAWFRVVETVPAARAFPEGDAGACKF